MEPWYKRAGDYMLDAFTDIDTSFKGARADVREWASPVADWMRDADSELMDGIRRYAGPHLSPQIEPVVRFAPEMIGPGADVRDMTDGAATLADALGDGDYMRALEGGALMAGGTLMAVVPGPSVSSMKRGVDEVAGVEPQAEKWARTKRARQTKTIAMPDGSRVPRPKNAQEVPNIRRMSLEDALSIARQEPHLIPSKGNSDGAYIGGPRDASDYRWVQRQRDAFDKMIDEGAEGADWYDRFRGDVVEVTGSDARDQRWMSHLEGQYSAGVAPHSELAFALKDTNSSVAYGSPVVARFPAQAEATARAIRENDPDLIQLGEKTGEYAHKVDPSRPHPETATGVNDFRHFVNLGYTNPDGTPVTQVKGRAAHSYADHETALAADRANRSARGGLTNWTGERIQAAAWVKQKADALFEQRRDSFMEKAETLVAEGDTRPVDEIAYDLAFIEANKTIGDFYDKHTAFATYEQQPFIDAGHLPGLGTADEAARREYASDPRGSWATADGGRDSIYAGMRLGDTGLAVRTRPTTDMQGVYTPPGGATEYNPGHVARPLVAFNAGDVKSMPEADRAIMDGAEATRAYIDVQGAGAWHKPWAGGKKDLSRSRFVSKGGAPSPMTPDELSELSGLAREYGFEDVVDTSHGATLTSFGSDLAQLSRAETNSLGAALKDIGYKTSDSVNVDSGYIGYEDAWRQGGGAATEGFLSALDDLPEGVVTALDNNPSIPERALAKMERDADFAAQHGAAREDVQNARRIIGEGPGWVGRLREALKNGQVLPGLAAAFLVPAYLLQDDDEPPA